MSATIIFGTLQMSATIIFGTLQMSVPIIFGTLRNNVRLIYIFEIFFPIDDLIRYGHVALLFFKVRYQNNPYQVLKWQRHKKIRKRGKVCQFQSNI